VLEIFSANPEVYKKKLESLTEGVQKYAHDFDPEIIHLWCESDPALNSAYKKFVDMSEIYADFVCEMDDLIKNGGDINEIILKQREAHTNSEKLLKLFVESAHKKGHLQEFSTDEMTRPKTAQLILFSAFTNAYEQCKMDEVKIRKAG
jgi:hypothetical protein